MAGRKPKAAALSTGKIGKEKRAARAIAEKKLKLSREQLLAPPAWLNDVAKAEFKRVVDEAAAIDLLDNLDRSVLSIYADSWSRYVQASQHIESDGPTVMRQTKDSEYEAVSPWVHVAEKYAKQIMACSTKLGMATTDRLKLVVPHPEDDAPENKFLKFIR